MPLKEDLKFQLLKERVDYHKDICFYSYSIIQRADKLIEIHTNGTSFSGVLMKDIAALCSIYNWSFGIYVDSNNKPYIQL